MTIAPSLIRVDVHEHARWRRTLSVTVPAEVVREEKERMAKRHARRLKLPGFKKGRTPVAVVERSYPALEKETLARVVDQAYRSALAVQAMHPISEGEVEKVDHRPNGDITFRVSFDVRPQIELPRLGGFKVERPALPVEPEQVDEVLSHIREEHALWRPPDEDGPPGDGDLVTVRIVRVNEGGEIVDEPATDVGLPWARRLRLREDTLHRGRYQLVLGVGDAIPAVEEAIRGLSPGATGEFDVGLEHRLRITLEDREVKELPELDDAFVRSLGDFADLTALRARVVEDIEERAAAWAETVVRARLVDLVLEANPFDPPRSMVERYADAMLASARQAHPEAPVPGRPEVLREAEHAVKVMLVLERVARLHDLTAITEEIEARIATIATGVGIATEQVRTQLTATNRMDALAREITDGKVFDFLKGKSEIVG